MLSPRWRKVARDLWNNKSRTVLVIASIAIGVFAFGGLFISRNQMLSDLPRQYEAIRPSDISFSLSEVDDDFVRWLERQPLVEVVQPRTIYPVELVAGGDVQTAQLISYKDYENLQLDLIRPEAGAYPPDLEEILLERSFVEWVGAVPGETVTLNTLDGEAYVMRFTGTVHDLKPEPGNINPVAPVYVSQRTLLRMGLSDGYNQIAVKVDRDAGVPLTLIAEDMKEEFERRGLTVASMTVSQEAQHWSADVLAGVTIVLVFAGLGSLVLSAFLVVNTISGIMMSQKKQIGVMKIIGASRPQIITIYMVMVGLLGLIAFVVAFPLSIALGVGLTNYFSDFLNYNRPPLVLDPIVVALEVVVALLVPLASALQPVLAGTRITAAEAITDHVVASRNNPIDVLLARLSGLPRPALISVRNTFRRKARLLVTLFTLTLAGAFFISIVNVRSGLLSDVDKLLALAGYDARFTLTLPTDTAGLERRAESFPGVAAVESWTFTSAVYERADRSLSETFDIVALPPESRFVDPVVISDGRWLRTPEAGGGEFELVLTDEILKDEPTMTVGSTVTLKQGALEEDFTVVGIADSEFVSFYMSMEAVQQLEETDDLANQLVIDISPLLPDADHAAFAMALTDYLEDRDIEVANTTLNVDIVEGVTGSFNVLVTVLLAMAILIAIVAGLGLTGTMSLNVMERTREIGVMRAVGAGNNAIRLMFVGEAVLIGVLSTLLALPLSYPGTVVFANVLGDVIFGYPLSIIVAPLGIVIWFGIVLMVSGAASVAPANRASQISIREAISYE